MGTDKSKIAAALAVSLLVHGLLAVWQLNRPTQTPPSFFKVAPNTRVPPAAFVPQPPVLPEQAPLAQPPEEQARLPIEEFNLGEVRPLAETTPEAEPNDLVEERVRHLVRYRFCHTILDPFGYRGEELDPIHHESVNTQCHLLMLCNELIWYLDHISVC